MGSSGCTIQSVEALAQGPNDVAPLGKGEAPASPPRPLLEVNRGGQVYEILFEPPPSAEDAKNASLAFAADRRRRLKLLHRSGGRERRTVQSAVTGMYDGVVDLTNDEPAVVTDDASVSGSTKTETASPCPARTRLAEGQSAEKAAEAKRRRRDAGWDGGALATTADDAPQPITGRPIQFLSLPGGVLDDAVLNRADAIAQQLNCVGCDGRGLAEGVAKKLPYGCSYAERRRMPPQNKFAVPGDRAEMGEIDVRRPPPGQQGPTVINLFAQWEMGAPGKYNRVQPAPPSDSAAARERAFKECLGKIGALTGTGRPSCIAFPYEIGCGLAGGTWRNYERMLNDFAAANPDMEVLLCRWTGNGGSRVKPAQGRKADQCFKCKQIGHWASQCPQRR